MKVLFPPGEYLRRLEILKSGQLVWKLDGVHVDTTNLQVPHQIEPPFTFNVIENDELVYSGEYDAKGVLVDAYVASMEEETDDIPDDS